ncbi:MAG: FHA domain-containing protein [Oscillospiraceae bacterium]
MNKVKVIKRKKETYIIVKSKKTQQLNMREVEAISKQRIDGLVCLAVKQRKKTFKITYKITEFITLRQYLTNVLDKAHFASLLDDIFSIFTRLQTQYYNNKNVLLDQRYMMVNPKTKKVSFVYVPVQNFENSMTLKEFYLGLANNAVFSPAEDTSFMNEYIRILNDGVNFSSFDLNEFIMELTGKATVKPNEIRCPKCKTITYKTANFCPLCGEILVQEIVKKDAVYNPLKNINKPPIKKVQERPIQQRQPVQPRQQIQPVQPMQPMQPIQQVQQVQQVQPMQPIQQVQPMQQVQPKLSNTPQFPKALFETLNYDSGTTVLGKESENSSVSMPYLVRKSVGETITINTKIFKLGKDTKTTDYCIMNNSAVSRNHANIIIDNHRFFVIDNNSTNKTFVNDQPIPANMQIEIFNNTKIRLANEDFVFYQ